MKDGDIIRLRHFGPAPYLVCATQELEQVKYTLVLLDPDRSQQPRYPQVCVENLSNTTEAALRSRFGIIETGINLADVLKNIGEKLK